MAPLEETVALLMDLNTLKFVGWDTSFGKYKGHGPGAVAELERILQENDHLAQQAFPWLSTCCTIGAAAWLGIVRLGLANLLS